MQTFSNITHRDCRKNKMITVMNNISNQTFELQTYCGTWKCNCISNLRHTAVGHNFLPPHKVPDFKTDFFGLTFHNFKAIFLFTNPIWCNRDLEETKSLMAHGFQSFTTNRFWRWWIDFVGFGLTKNLLSDLWNEFIQ